MKWLFGLLLVLTCSLFSQEYVTVTAPLGSVKAEIVDTDETRTLGLSNRPSLDQGKGMLFKFDKPQRVYIWMKDMQFSIDVVWLNRKKIVTYIERDFSPETYKKNPPLRICSPKPDTMYVLELPAGEASRLGITLGAQLTVSSR